MHDYILDVPREQQADRRKIRTFTGRYVNPLEVRARDISLADVAHHLSIINRYTGASPWALSVAQHSVLCAELAAGQWDHWVKSYPEPCTRRDWIAAHAMHDAGEYLFNDLASPVKKDPRMAWYRAQEHQTTRLIFCVFGIDPALLELTKPLDDACFFAEARSFWADSKEVRRWSAVQAERAFLRLANELKLEPVGGLQ